MMACATTKPLLRRHIASVLMLLCFAFHAHAQSSAADAFATVSTTRDKMQVGEQAKITISVQGAAADTRIGWPQIPDSFGALEVVKKEKIDTGKNGTFLQQSFYLSGWDSGVTTIPPFVVTVMPKGGTPHNIQTGALTIAISTVPVDTTKPIKPIKGIMGVEGAWLDYIWWYIGALALLIVGIVLYYYLRKRKPAAAPVPQAPPELEHEKALRRLAALEEESLWQKGEVKEYYVRLTDILRHYIEARFRMPALERTTDELMAATNSHTELVFHRDRLYSILATADMAKFARAQPTAPEHIMAMQAAKDFVTATIPKPTPDAGGALPHTNTPTFKQP